jgi:hypothetical protein
MKRFAAPVAMILGLLGATHASAALAGDIMATKAPPPPPSPPAPTVCTDVVEFFTTSCPLSWNGITVYGTVDAGV